LENECDIAIVGLAGRFPGARNLDEFWKNLVGGVESIARLSDQEIIEAGVSPTFLGRPDYVKAAPVLDDPGLFDAAFFGFSPAEASTMDPQHRLLLELAHEALEDAGCDPARFAGRIGVFAGSAMNTYFMNRGLNNRLAEDYIPTLIFNDKDFLSTRISCKLGLRGPSRTVQTGCSTSLVCVHLARQSLLNEETDLALAGAVSVRVPHRAGYFYDGGGVVSPDGHVRAFDAGANGTVFGSGGGVVVLRRLADALAQGDPIRAVIKGSAVNNDGPGKAGYTAPSVNGQADVIVEALANAGVDAEGISYLEAHGSGTPVGDTIEILALTKAFRKFTQRNGYCAIGSVKTNVGHLDAAAGMAGLIKTVLALEHRCLPPTLHYSRPNPEIDFPATPFYVNTRTVEWPQGGGPRRAGVMASGRGGTNAHVILEEAPAAKPVTDSDGPYVLALSAKTPSALDAMSRNLADALASFSSDPQSAVSHLPGAATPPYDEAGGHTPELGGGGPANRGRLADVAYTLQTGRRSFSCRRFVVCSHTEDAIAALKTPDSKNTTSGSVEDDSDRPVVFLFPGVGDHYVGMGQGLYEHFKVFREEVDRCAQILQPLIDIDLRELLYPRNRVRKQPAKPRGIDLRQMLGRATDEPPDPAAQKLDQTIHCQPALFSVEYALAQLWLHWGVKPDRMVGHSMGEYVAACLAGVLSLEDALRLVAVRAKLVNDLPHGAMLAVMLPEDQLLPMLGEQLSISLINGPKLCVVAGPVAPMAAFQSRLKELQIIFRPVRNAHAFHSRMLDPIIDPFLREMQQIRLKVPSIPFISNVTGTWITAEQAQDPFYWVDHARRPARFSNALAQLWKLPDCLPLEVGPGRTLGVLAMQHPARAAAANPLVLSSLRHDYENQPDPDFILNSVGRLWLAGAEIDWEKLLPRPGRRKLSLPSYPFERQRHWLEPPAGRRPAATIENSAAQKADLSDWFYIPTWEKTGFPTDTRSAGGDGTLWLIIAEQSDFASRLVSTLEHRGATAVLACFGDSFARRNDGAYEIRPACLPDYMQLLEALKTGAGKALNVVHLGPLSSRVKGVEAGYDELSQELGFYSLLNLAQAIGEQNTSPPVRIGVVTSQIHEVTGEETLNPAMATVLGPCGVMPKEYPNVTSFSVDLPTPASVAPDLEEFVVHLLGEFRDPAKGGVIAYRGKYRWEMGFKPQRLPPVTPQAGDEDLRAQGLRPRGVYLITGGTGGIGLAIAKYLAETCQARLVLTKKTPFPEKSAWRQRLGSADLPDSDRHVISALLEIEALGGEVDVFTCEASDRTGMKRVLEESLAKHHVINGVIHAAGIVRDGVIQLKTREVAASVLSPKVDGTFVLYEISKNLDLDVLVLFSSISSVIPLHGQSDYCAANAFLDRFPHFSNSHARFRTLTINWPGWREVGILAGLKTPAGLESQREATLNKAILTKDGLEVFKRALGSKLPRVIVSPQELKVVKDESTEPRQLESCSRAPASSRPDPMRDGATIDKPRNEVEQALADIWSGVFGITPIGVHENFLDLGGHSLLAMQIVSKIRFAYRMNLTLRSFFEAPTIAQLSAVVQAGSGAVAGSPPTEEPIRALPRAAQRTLSSSERRFWFFDHLEPGSSVYNSGFQLALVGEVRLDVLERSLAMVVARHDALRTRYPTKDGEPFAVVDPPETGALPVVEAVGADPEREAARLLELDAERHFDLTARPPWRALIVRISEMRFVLGFTFHHIIIDGWSVGVFTKELMGLYEALTKGQAPQLAELRLQYADFAAWESKWVHSEEARRQTDYWRERLAGVRVMNLPADFPRPRVQTFLGGRCTGHLSADLSRRLGEFSRSHDATPFVTLLAAFGLLLHRLSGVDDVPIGVPVAGRERKGTDLLIGTFINTIVLRQNHSSDPSFEELLRSTRKQALDAYSNAELPFDIVVSAVHAPRDAGRTPLFQVFVNNLDLSVGGRFSLPGMECELKVTQVPASKFDMTLYLGLEEDATRLMLCYNSDLFAASRMEELRAQFEQVLGQVLRNAELRGSELSLVTPSAAAVLPDPVRPLAVRVSGCLPASLTGSVAHAAERVAVTGRSVSWTREELEARANRLAQQLLENGLRRQEVVAIYAHREPALVCAMQAVLKAGGAFTILDAAYPAAQLTACWRAAAPRAAVLIVGAGNPPSLLEGEMRSVAPKLCIHLSADGTASGPSSGPWKELALPSRPNEIAYVASAPATMGAVKGILGTHAHLVHFLEWQARTFALGPDDRFGMLSGLSRDMLLREVFAALWVGGSIHVPAPASMGERGGLADWIAREKLTVLHLTPAMVKLVTAAPDRRMNSLRWVFVSGDVLSAGTVDRLRRAAPNAACVNLYGATETRHAVAFYVVPPSGERRARVPIGRGIDGVQVLIVNSRNAMAGVGEPGEIVIRTPYLVLGNGGEAQLPPERITVSPFCTDPEDRVYRTGDLGRYLPDGGVEFCGRGDGQVKVGGFPIELGEIEAALEEHPSVSDAAVGVWEEPNGQRRLIGYVIPSAGVIPAWETLRAFLRERLPEYAVPGAFAVIDSIPLTPDGEIERKALPKVEAIGPEGSKGLAAQRDALEQQLVRVWEGILNRTPIGIKDDFFEQGGHSLLAVRLFSEIEKLTGKMLPLVTLFEARTIEQLAAVLKGEGWQPRWTSLVPIKPDGSKPPFYCVHGVGGNILEFEDFSRYIDADQPLYGIQAQGLGGKRPRLKTVEEMAAHYISEIREFQPEGPYYLGGSSFGGVVAYEMAQRLVAQNQRIGLLVMFDSFAPGYPKWPSKTTALAKQLSYWRFRMDLHWENLKEARGSEKWTYITAKLVRLKRQLRRQFKNARARVKGTIESRLHPKTIREVREAGRHASERYEATPYPGIVTLLRATVRRSGIYDDPTNGWSEYARGVDVHHVPGHHGSIMREPRARVLVEKLTACLNNAYRQAAAGAPQRPHITERDEESSQGGRMLELAGDN